MSRRWPASLLLGAIVAWLSPAGASAAPGSRLLATGGATTVEGTAGGGLVPWAVLAGYGRTGEHGGTVSVSAAQVDDFSLRTAAAAWTFGNRLELSVARQRFDLGDLGQALALPDPYLDLDIAGAKWRAGGDLVYGRMPQVAIGVLHKRQRDFAVPALLGAARDDDWEAYVAVSKLLLGGAGGYNLLVNGVVRHTRANQLGLLGFGATPGSGEDGHSLQFEASTALLLTRRLAIGVEYRQKPDQLLAAAEDDWRDAFVAWFPNKRVALVAAWVHLGSIGGLPSQDGVYLSLQGSF